MLYNCNLKVQQYYNQLSSKSITQHAIGQVAAWYQLRLKDIREQLW